MSECKKLKMGETPVLGVRDGIVKTAEQHYTAQKNENYAFMASSVLPDGNGGFTPCPPLLTEDEAILYLRLDKLNVKDPRQTLTNLRAVKTSKDGRPMPRLEPTPLGGVNFYRREELDRFLKEYQKFYAEKN